MNKRFTVLLLAASFAAQTKANSDLPLSSMLTENFSSVFATGYGPLKPQWQGKLSDAQAQQAIYALIAQDWTTAQVYFRTDQNFGLTDFRTDYLKKLTYLEGGNPNVSMISDQVALQRIQSMYFVTDQNAYTSYSSMVYYPNNTDGVWDPPARERRFGMINGQYFVDKYCLNIMLPKKTNPPITYQPPDEQPHIAPQRVGMPGIDNSSNANNSIVFSPTIYIAGDGGGTSGGYPVVYQQPQKKSVVGQIAEGLLIGGGVYLAAKALSPRQQYMHRQPIYNNYDPWAGWNTGVQTHVPTPIRYNTSSLNSTPAGDNLQRQMMINYLQQTGYYNGQYRVPGYDSYYAPGYDSYYGYVQRFR